ncbi:MAG: 5'-methylthioadenosine/adenosylhomocysteine nucleosidase [Propionibacterium sp.]|nr:5'-methylthioadenosine/adenosylhomocysteine nucleosidase [Propionibacterium sp.]
MLAFLGAIEAEIVSIRGRLRDAVELTVGSTVVTVGIYTTPSGTRRPVAVATCGVGKVNAALAVAALAQAGVTEAVFTGVAGGVAPGLRVGDLVVATDLVQHDVDLTALGRPRGELLGEPFAWPADPELAARVLDAARAAATGSTGRVLQGRIASGDQFVADRDHGREIHTVFGALCTEMEGAAFAQACTGYRIAFAVVRAISDTADGDAPSDFPSFLTRASEVGQALADALVDRQP